MPQKITETAALRCDKGTITTSLTVTSQDFFLIGGKKAATEQDKQTGANIKPFGQCKLKPTTGGYLPCIPSAIAWQNTTLKDEINGYKILLDISTCPCATGGTISVKNKGHEQSYQAE